MLLVFKIFSFAYAITIIFICILDQVEESINNLSKYNNNYIIVI